ELSEGILSTLGRRRLSHWRGTTALRRPWETVGGLATMCLAFFIKRFLRFRGGVMFESRCKFVPIATTLFVMIGTSCLAAAERNCDDAEGQRRALELEVCVETFNCGALGTSYSALQKMTDRQIDDLLETNIFSKMKEAEQLIQTGGLPQHAKIWMDA